MIVVVGSPALRAAAPGREPVPDGATARIALAAARAGSTVQVVGRIGDDPAGDALVLALAEAGVGHVALLRDAGRRTEILAAAPPAPEAPPEAPDEDDDPRLLTDDVAAEPLAEPATDGPATTPHADGATPGLDAADVDLGLRYLTDFDVLVVGPEVQGEAARTATGAAGWAGAVPILVIPQGSPAPETTDAIVLEAPVEDPDGAFADLVGVYAAALDRGEAPDKALRSLAGSRGWERAEAD